MNKLYNLITFHNGTTPALNEDNLNAMSQALDGIDDRVVSLGGAVLEVIPDLEDMLSNAEMLQQYKEDAEAAAGSAEDDKEDAEAYAVGTRNGVPVTSEDPAYHNNAKYYSEQTDPTAFANMSDVDFDNLQNGQVAKYNSTTGKWENANESGGVTSFNGRTGAVVPANGDYNANNIDYDNTISGISATTSQGAIDKALGIMTAGVSGAIGDTYVDITNANISNNKILYPYYSNASGDAVGFENITVTGTTARVTFTEALTEIVTVYLHIKEV